MYGYDAKSLEDPCVVAVRTTLDIVLPLMAPGATWVNILPALACLPSWFPGASTQKRALMAKHLREKTERDPFNFAKDHTVSKH